MDSITMWYSVQVPVAVYEKFRHFQATQNIQPGDSMTPMPATLMTDSQPQPQHFAQQQEQQQPDDCCMTNINPHKRSFPTMEQQHSQQQVAGSAPWYSSSSTAAAVATGVMMLQDDSSNNTSTKKHKQNNNNVQSNAQIKLSKEQQQPQQSNSEKKPGHSASDRLPALQLPVTLTAEYYTQSFEAMLLHIDDESGERYNAKVKGRSGRQAPNRIFIMITAVPQTTDGNNYNSLVGTVYDNPSAAAFAFQSNSEPGWSAFKVKDSGIPLGLYRTAKFGNGFRNHPAMTNVHRDLLAKQVQRTSQRNSSQEAIPRLATNEEMNAYRHLTVDHVFQELNLVRPPISL